MLERVRNFVKLKRNNLNKYINIVSRAMKKLPFGIKKLNMIAFVKIHLYNITLEILFNAVKEEKRNKLKNSL